MLATAYSNILRERRTEERSRLNLDGERADNDWSLRGRRDGGEDMEGPHPEKLARHLIAQRCSVKGIDGGR